MVKISNNIYGAIGLIGGATGDLDKIDGAALLDKDIAFALEASVLYPYSLDADSAAAESSPDVIAADANGGDKRWILADLTVDALNARGVVNFANTLTMVQGKQVYYNGTTDYIVSTGANTLQIKSTAIQLNGAVTVGAAGLTVGATTPSAAQWGYLGGSVAGGGALMALALGAADLKTFVNAAGTAPEWAKGMNIGSFSRDTATTGSIQAVTGVGFKPSAVIFIMCEQNTAEASWGFDVGDNQYVLARAGANYRIHDGFSIYDFHTVDANEYYGQISSFDADGFTITWVKGGSPTGTIQIRFIAFR